MTHISAAADVIKSSNDSRSIDFVGKDELGGLLLQHDVAVSLFLDFLV